MPPFCCAAAQPSSPEAAGWRAKAQREAEGEEATKWAQERRLLVHSADGCQSKEQNYEKYLTGLLLSHLRSWGKRTVPLVD